MSRYDEFRFSFRDSSAEEKLQILRSESFRTLPIIQGFSELLRRALEKSETVEKPDELNEWILKIRNSSQTLHDLIDVMTSSQNQERGIPELRPYDNLLDAVRDTAQKSTLSLAKAIDDTSRIFVYSGYPLVLRDEPKFHRQIYFHLANSKYVVELLSWIDNRMFQSDLQVSFSTLDDVAIVINQWLLEKRTLDEMQALYPSSKKSG
jgi:hypothetical protein